MTQLRRYRVHEGWNRLGKQQPGSILLLLTPRELAFIIATLDMPDPKHELDGNLNFTEQQALMDKLHQGWDVSWMDKEAQQ